MIRLRLATQNPHKLREVRAIMEPRGFDVVGLDNPDIVVDEDGDTFEANAIKKAQEVADLLQERTLADDSGLEVEALGGAPGVHSARYAGVSGADADAHNRNKLLQALAPIPTERRQARFVCVLAWTAPDEKARTVRGELHGRIAETLRGSSGFGYDALFIPEGESRTLAEMTAAEKNAISHRSRALAALVRTLSP